MTIDDLLDALRERGIIVAYDGARLHIDAPAGSFTPDLQAEVRRHRDAIVRRLSTGAGQEGEPTPNDTIPAADVAEWIERTDADGRRIIERADVAGLEIIDIPDPCTNCGNVEVWQDLDGGLHCVTCSPAPKTGERLRRLRDRIRKRSSGKHGPNPDDWPAAQADFVLPLAPDDLPTVPFRLNGKTTVWNRERFLSDLKSSIRIGSGGYHARRGILQAELQALHRLLIQGSET